MPVNTLTRKSGGSGRLVALSLALAILILCSAPVIAAQKITRVQVANLGEKVEVGITASEPISYSSIRSGSFLAFDIKGSCYAKPGRVRISGDKVRSVRYGRFRPAVTRVAFATRGAVSHTARFLNGKKQLVIDVWKSSARPVSSHPVAKLNPAPKPSAAMCLVPAVESAPAVDSTPASLPIAKTAVMGVAEPVVGQPTETAEAAPPAPAPIVNVAAAPVSDASAPGSPVRVSRRAAVDSSTESGRTISLDFNSADINDILKALSLQSGRNIVSGSDVKGQVTVSLNRASFDEALQYVAKLSGYNYAKADDNTYLVGNNVGQVISGGDSATVSEAVSLRVMVPTDETIKMLTGDKDRKGLFPNLQAGYVKPPGDQATGPKGLSTILLSGSSEDVAGAKAVLQKMEDALSQSNVGGVTQLYRIKYSDASELITMLGQVLPAVSATYGPTPGFKIDGKETVKVGLTAATGDYQVKIQPDYLVLTGQADAVKQAISLFDQLDVRQAQILIEAKVVDLNNDAAKELGVKWDWQPFVYRQNVPETDKGEPKFPLPPTKSLSHMPLGFSAVLDAMVTSGKGKVLANPKVAVMEGKPGVVFIGDQIKYVVSITQGTNGPNVTTETANVGVQLQVLGRVNPDNRITLNIRPEVSAITDFVTFGQGQNAITLPQIASRYTASTIRIQDGDTIVIGGLIKDSDITNLRKVPFFGDLPFFGNLFRHRSTTREHSEVVISITATVIKD
jgi:type II secretory pathway component GspD/PulD (secretin)